MTITVKTSIAKPAKSTVNVAASDSEKLIAALDKLKGWAKYTPNLSVTPKYGKDKKMSDCTIAAKPTTKVPKWSDYSRNTKDRQAEWDKMFPKLEKYLDNHHDKLTKAIEKAAKELEKEDFEKSDFDKWWKTKKTELEDVSKDYASKTSDGTSEGVSLDVIDPDPVEVATDIKSPSTTQYAVSGKSIKGVYDALAKRKFWGRYRSNGSAKMEFAYDGCLKKITVKAAPVITMPKWAEYSKMTKEQKAEWDKMWGLLNTHENNHHDIFTKGMKTLLDNIEPLKQKEANTYWTDENKTIQDAQDTYDTSSAHGVNEGVSLDASVDP
ncbi:MAG: DUF922 domain-containing protein [Pseudooceanicola sp.]|nr:DUF922 domain-containing protein [Pseudooceanicola sp.]